MKGNKIGKGWGFIGRTYGTLLVAYFLFSTHILSLRDMVEQRNPLIQKIRASKPMLNFFNITQKESTLRRQGSRSVSKAFKFILDPLHSCGDDQVVIFRGSHA
jgi:hypothetical protein